MASELTLLMLTITHIDNFALKLELPTDTVLSAPAEEFAPMATVITICGGVKTESKVVFAPALLLPSAMAFHPLTCCYSALVKPTPSL
ncbi:hypothetical protein MWK71_17115 [Escherichia coli]|nr:hypothetical protein [Escherichia coli]